MKKKDQKKKAKLDLDKALEEVAKSLRPVAAQGEQEAVEDSYGDTGTFKSGGHC